MKQKDAGKIQAENHTRRKAGAPPGRRQAEKRRRALLETAGDLFIAKGIETTTMDEIAVRAKVAKGTLYHYFASKADLLGALRQIFIEDFMARIVVRVESCPPGDWVARIKAWIDETVNAYFDMSGLHDVVFHDFKFPHSHAMTDMDFNRYLGELIDNGTKAGAWQIDDPAWTAVIIYYALHGACDEARFGRQSMEDISRKLSTLFLKMLGVDG